MEEATSKEKILKKIRKALIQKSDKELPDVDFESAILWIKYGLKAQ